MEYNREKTILIDGVPNAIIVPYLFVEYFQTLDDYSVNAVNKVFIEMYNRGLIYT